MAGNCCPRPGGTACTPRPCRILTVVWPPHSCSLLAAMTNLTFSTGWGCPPGVCRNSSVPVKFKLKSWQSHGIFGTVKCKQALHGSCHACLRVGGQMKTGGHHHPMCKKPVKSGARVECTINKLFSVRNVPKLEQVISSSSTDSSQTLMTLKADQWSGHVRTLCTSLEKGELQR